MRALVVADSGPVMAALTRALVELDRMELRHASGRTRVGAIAAAFAPELVLIDEMGWPPLALGRISEVRAAAPGARIIVLASRLEGGWLAEALRMGVAAVMPANADDDTFRQVLGEVLAQTPAAA